MKQGSSNKVQTVENEFADKLMGQQSRVWDPGSQQTKMEQQGNKINAQQQYRLWDPGGFIHWKHMTRRSSNFFNLGSLM